MKYLFVIILSLLTLDVSGQYAKQWENPYDQVGAPGYEECIKAAYHFSVNDLHSWVEYLKKATKKGNLASRTDLAKAYMTGIDGVLKRDTAFAIKELCSLSHMGLPEAQYELGCCFFHGNGVQKDLNSYAMLMDASAKQGYLPAKIQMSQILLNGGFGIKQNTEQGLSLLEDCANSGDIISQENMAAIYLRGYYEVKPDTIIALKWLESAVKNGSRKTCNTLAYLYAKGEIVEQNFYKAHNYIKQARSLAQYKGDLTKEIEAELLAYDGEIYMMEGKEQDATIVWEKFKKEYNEFIDKYYSEPTAIFVRTMYDKDISKKNEVALAEKGARKENIISDVDEKIPELSIVGKPTFVVLIANENYNEVGKVPFAIHDGETFCNYCEKTLGIPRSNIHFTADATLNNIKRELNWLSQVMEVYNGEANIIFYYAGHGIPNESNGSAYLLPVDGVGNDVTTGYSLDKLYADLGSKPAKSVIVLLDACFSGARRDGGMLASARGVAIKAKQNAPKGNMVVLSAAQGDETAYPYKDKGHGLFTYYLLKKLQESKGNVTLGELADYVTAEVKKQSVVVNGKMQTPLASPSNNATDWRNWKLR
ncbi:MAG: caspase family protein [Prevotella sp.]|nr:caspase family protein [Prevotella sp.]